MNGLASDSDFLNVDWYEWKEQGLLMVSLKNVLVGSNGPNYARKMACLCTSGSALRIFFLILRSERDQELHENYFNVFSWRNSCLGQMGQFWPKNGASS